MRARSLRLILGLLTAFACASFVVAARAQVQAPTRQGQSTTTLADGRVLIAGGDTDGTAEVFDPSTSQTSPVAARMVVARASHGAVRLANGNVLIVGGYSAGTQSVEQSVEIFDVSTEQFAKIGGARTPRILPTLTLRADGIVQISGGDAGNSTEFYDPVTNTLGDDPAAPSITTDRSDYAPGETVTFTGSRWAPGEVVTIVLHEEPEVHQDYMIVAVAGDEGSFTNTDFAPEDHDIGVTFHVTATGATSNQTAQAVFTDAAPPSSTYNFSSGSGTILSGGTDIGNHCDDCTTTIFPPFPITFYSNIFTALVVSSNGNIQFGGAAFENPNFCLPTGIFNGAIAPYWDDLRTDLPAGSGKGIFTQTTGTAPNRQFHIRWETSYWQSLAPTWFGSARFAVVFDESQPQFDFLYGPISGNSATVGVQRTSSGPFTQYACNISSVPSGTRLTFAGIPIATATTTTLSASPSPSGLGQNVNFVATVLWSGNAVTSGTVTLNDGPTTIATSSLNQFGQATFPVSSLSVGSHAMTASYSGSGGLQPSTGMRTHVVNKGNTTTTIVSGTNPSIVGQSVTLTASVNPVAPATGTATGTVQFRDGGVDIGSPVTLSSGSASLSTSFMSTGAHSITAVYAGDADSNTSTSASISQTVNKATTTTAVTSDVNPSVFGQAVMFTATVSPIAPGSGTPGGTVQFRDNGVDVGSPVTLTDGCASFTTNSLTTGTHLITAVYSGDSGFDASTERRPDADREQSFGGHHVEPGRSDTNLQWLAAADRLHDNPGRADGCVGYL